MRKLILPLACLSLFPVAAFSQPKGWNDPFPPHKVMDNMYFVGTKELATFLIVTPAGNILMNSWASSSATSRF
jgi:metallo-beta-lactamase class B